MKFQRGLVVTKKRRDSSKVGIAATLMALPLVILIPLTYRVYKERVSGRGLAGTALAVGGVALIFLA